MHKDRVKRLAYWSDYGKKNRKRISARRKIYYSQPEPKKKRAAYMKEYGPKWVKANPDKVKEKKKRYLDKPESKIKATDTRLRNTFGISYNDYQALWITQGGVCAICNKPETRVVKSGPTQLAVDHDHATGKIRKLLCHKCNVALGLLDENPDRMRSMAEYIESFPKRSEPE